MNPPQSGLATTTDADHHGVTARPDGALGGQLGAPATPRLRTFHGSDPDTVAASAICRTTPTKCQARTRLYRSGRLVLEGFPVAAISDHLADEAVIWLDLRDPDREDLAVLRTSSGCTRLLSRTRCSTGSAPSSTDTAHTCS